MMPTEKQPGKQFNVREARAIIHDLFEQKPYRYYLDLLLSASIGWTGYVLALGYPMFTTGSGCYVLIAVLAFFRTLNLIHPIFHLPAIHRDRMRIAFDLVFGIPFLAPYFLYERSHAAHHKLSVYGTLQDPEYIRFTRLNRYVILGFSSLNILLPPALYLRFSVGTLLSYFHPALRRKFLTSISSFSVRRSFRRPLPEGTEKKVLLMEESVASVYAMGLLIATMFSVVTPQLILQGLLIGVLLALMNAAQFLTLHRYDEPGADLDAQILDTWNSPGSVSLINEIWAPVGQRFHALHHCFPTLPYHNLAKAHRRLKQELSHKSIYHSTENPGFYRAVSKLWLKASS
jgi:fatty acid desaturase